MAKINKSALVEYSASDMYSLVNDVAKYPEFVSGCRSAQVITADDSSMTAQLTIARAGIESCFTTHNRLLKDQSITMELADGPFEYLTGKWQFIPLSESASKVIFEVDFKFKSQLMDMAFSKVFKTTLESMVQAFVDRAKQLGDKHES
ncbi:MAG: type II toxin-antitoxin system RatA family toxin [Kangiellaceae bacterium]|jgi:ribosome-associated toxin RatA of RatAB toxin-antitoxin module|nr:type II toxin-antitoxin system RatA family toxin [Kangiellaceae bacterium]